MSRVSEVEEITLSDSDEEPEVVDAIPVAAPKIVFYPQFQPLLMGEPVANLMSDAPEEVYPENYVVYEPPPQQAPEQPLEQPLGQPEQPVPPSGSTPDVLNPFACDFEELNNIYFGVPAAEEVLQQKKKSNRPPARPRSKQHQLQKLAVNAVVAKAQLQKLACSDASDIRPRKSKKRADKEFNNTEFELLKDVQNKDCYVSLERLTLKTLIKNNASQSSINLFKSFPQPKEFDPNKPGPSTERKVQEILKFLNVPKSNNGQAEPSTSKLISDNPTKKFPGIVRIEIKLGSQSSNDASVAIKNCIQARIAQLMTQQEKDAANNYKTQKTAAVKAHNSDSWLALKHFKIKVKDCKIVLRDLKTLQFIKIGSRLVPVVEILSQCEPRPIKVLEGQLLCEKTGCPIDRPPEPSPIITSNLESEPIQPPESSPITISEDEYLDDQTGSVKTIEPELKESQPTENTENKPKPRLMVRKDLFAPVPRAICEAPVRASPYVICDYGKDTPKKSDPVEPPSTPSSPPTATSFKTQLKNKLFSSLKTDTNSLSVGFQAKTVKTTPVHISKLNGFKASNTNGLPVTVIADHIYSYLPKKNSSEKIQQKQHSAEKSTVRRPCPKSKRQNHLGANKMSTDSDDMLNNNRLKEPVKNHERVNSVSQKRCENASSESDSEDEPLSNVKSKVDDNEGQNSHNSTGVKQLSIKSRERSKLKIKMCTVVIEDCEKLITNKSPEQDSGVSSRSDSSTNMKVASSRSSSVENSKSPEVLEKSRSKSPELPKASMSESPVVPEVDQSSSEDPEVNRSISPEVQQVDKSKSPETDEPRRSRTPEVEETNRSQSSEAEEASQSPELIRRSKSTESREQSSSGSLKAEEVNRSKSPDKEKESPSKSKEIKVVSIFRPTEPGKQSRSRSIDDEMPSTSKTPSPDIRLGKRSRSYEDGDECPKKKHKSDDSSVPKKINPTVFNVPNESFASQSVLDDLFSVDGTLDIECFEKDFRHTSKIIQPRVKVRKSSYSMLAKEVFGVNAGTSQKLAFNENILSLDKVSDLEPCDIGTNCKSMTDNFSEIEQKCKNSKLSYDRFKMKVFDVVEGVPIGGKLLNEYHLDGNFDSETSDDEVLTKKKARLKAKSRLPKSGPKKISNPSKNQRRSSRNLPDSADPDCSSLLTDFAVDKSKIHSSSKKNSESLNVDESCAVSTVKPVESIVDEKLSDKKKPIIKVIRLNYEKVKDGISVMDLGLVLSATSRSTSVNRRKQGKPCKFGINMISRNGGIRSPPKSIRELEFMVRNPKKRNKVCV